jgi:hypothetical protein
MMGEWRGAGTHLALLVLALALAYQTWTRGEERAVHPSSGSIRVLAGTPAELDFVELAGPRAFLRLERRTDGGGSYVWGAFEVEGHKIGFVGGEAADQLLQNLAPLRALRVLGKAGPEARKEYGLDAATETLRVSIAGKVAELQLGARLYGGDDRYAELAATGDVVVLPGENLLIPLANGPAQLMQHELHRTDGGNPVRMTVQRGSLLRTLAFIGGTEPGWADERNPDVRNDAKTRWAALLHSITITEYVDPAHVAELPAEKLVSVEYFGADRRKLGFIELVKGTSSPPTYYYIRTERTRGLGRINEELGAEIEKNLGAVLSVD